MSVTLVKSTVTAADVRAWFAENPDKVPAEAAHTVSKSAKGRIHPAAREVYNKHNRGSRQYTEGTPKTVAVEYRHKQPSGRMVKKVANLPYPEARDLAGVKSARGVLSKDALTRAGEALTKRLAK